MNKSDTNTSPGNFTSAPPRSLPIHEWPDTDRLAWEDACRRLHQAQQLGGAVLVATYRNAVEQNSDAVERLIKAAREDVAHAELYTALMVASLGVSTLRKGRRP